MERDDAAGEEPVTARLEKPLAREQRRELVRLWEAADARGQVRVRVAAGQNATEQRHDPVEPERGRTARACRAGVVISRIPSRPPRSQHAAQLAQPGLEVRDVADRRSRRRPTSKLRVLERQREHVALDQLDSGRLAARALEHPLGEVEADDVRRARLARGDGEIARAAARVEDT